MIKQPTVNKMVKGWVVAGVASFVLTSVALAAADRWARDSVDRAIVAWPFCGPAVEPETKWWESQIMERFTRLT